MGTARRTDAMLLAVTLLLVTFGLAMVYSASAVVAHERYHDSLYFLKRQMVWAVLGLLLMWAARYVPYRVHRRLVWPLLVGTLIALILVFVPSLSKEVGGARRWLTLGLLSLQPSELAKYVLIVYVAWMCASQQEPQQQAHYGLHLGILGLFCVLIGLQPDFGTAVVLAAAVGLQLLIAGLPRLYLVFGLATGLVGVIWGIVYEPYRLRRLMNFLHPWDDPQGGGYQAIQSLLALGSGGLFGTGLGRSQQKLFYLPEAHTDFIFAVIGEELGFLGTTGLVLLFGLLLWRVLRIALLCREPFGTLLGLGVFMMLALQILMNLGVVIGLLPTKGLPLPFISLGGSNLMVSLLAIGTMLNMAQADAGGSLHAGARRRA